MRRLIVVALLPLLLAGCGAVVPLAVSVPASIIAKAREQQDPVPIEVPNPGTGGGSIVSAETMPNLDLGLFGSDIDAARVVYRSVSVSGGVSGEMSASVFTPKGDAPEGGWPIISFAHGTTGIEQACAPSLSNTLLGSAPLVQGYTSAGYAVAIADYEGLGEPGVHAYLDNIYAGYDVIDAVRALRNLYPNAGTKWAAFGGSQGGGAAWAANELAAGYAPELELVGSASLAPAANMVGLVDKSIAGTLTEDQGPLMQWVLESLARRPLGFDVDQYRTGAAAADWEALTACTPDGVSARDAAAQRLGPTDFAPKTEDAANVLRYLLGEMAVPKQQASAPMFVAYGDADTFIDVEWTDQALVAACAMGDTITIDRQAGRGHGDVDGGAVNQWLGERFAGDPARNDCG